MFADSYSAACTAPSSILEIRPVTFGLARLISPGRQPEVYADLLRRAEPAGIVDGGHEGQRHDRADPRRRRQQPVARIAARRLPHPLLQAAQLAGQHPARRQQRFGDGAERWLGFDQLPNIPAWGSAKLSSAAIDLDQLHDFLLASVQAALPDREYRYPCWKPTIRRCDWPSPGPREQIPWPSSSARREHGAKEQE